MSEQRRARRVGDVVPPRAELPGLQYNVRDLVGKEFQVIAMAKWDGDRGPYLAVSIEIDGQPGFFFTSHLAIFRKLLLCQDDLPLWATVIEREGKASGNQYFDIE